MGWITALVVVAVLLGIIGLIDLRSRRIRGHTGRMRVPSRISRGSDADVQVLHNSRGRY